MLFAATAFHVMNQLTTWLNAYDIDCSPTENCLYLVGREENSIKNA